MNGRVLLIIAVVALIALAQGGGGGLPLPVVVQPDAATLVYEKDNNVITSAVMSALNTLNREKKITATIVDKDVKNGNGQTPDQYKLPIEEATKAGLPALVVTAGATLVRVVKDPKTEADVMEAVK